MNTARYSSRSMSRPSQLVLSKFCRLSIALMLIGLTGVSAFSQAAVSDCKVGKRAPESGFWTWAPRSELEIYVREQDFKSDEIPFLLKPLPLWDAIRDVTSIRLKYKGTTNQMRNCSNCVTIMRQKVFNSKTRHGSELKAFGLEGTRVIQYAAIYLDPKITGLETLTNAVAHELGHSFGLLDCYHCAGGTTVMNRLSGMSSSNGMEGPTSCDVAGVKAAFLELEARLRLTPALAEIVDEGEEPVDDDTPVINPQP